MNKKFSHLKGFHLRVMSAIQGEESKFAYKDVESFLGSNPPNKYYDAFFLFLGPGFKIEKNSWLKPRWIAPDLMIFRPEQARTYTFKIELDGVFPR